MKHRIIILITILLIVVSTFFIGNKVINDINIKNNKLFDLIQKEPTDTNEQRQEVIEKITNALNENRISDASFKEKAMSELGKLHSMNGDYIESIEYFVKAIDIAKREKNNYTIGKNLINLSTIFIELGGYKTAEESLNYALNIEIENEKQNYIIKEYVYINLADLYSRIGESKKAIELINKSLDYDKPDGINNKNEVTIRKIIAARALLFLDDIKNSEKIINTIDINDKNENLVEIYIPYLSVMSQLEFAKGNNDLGVKYAEELFYLCDKENQKDIALVNMKHMMKSLSESKDESKKEILNNYKDKIIVLYDEVMEKKDKENIFYIIDNIKDKVNYLDSVDARINTYYEVTIISILALIAFYILIQRLRKTMAENIIDGLTQVYNRRFFDITYNKYLEKNIEFGLIVIDIDYFKLINDNYGHEFGDIVLKKVSKTSKNKLSKSESIFRYGGEEFCIICKNKSIESTIDLAEKIRIEVENIIIRDNIKVTVSLGVSHTSTSKDIFKDADNNLYKSKKNGRNKVSY